MISLTSLCPPRRLPLFSLLCCLFVLLGTLAHAAAAKRPNVLLIFIDDLRTELGCYGVAGIKTPHIDALAQRSVRFDRAYAQFPLCNPSRASLLTGRYPTATGVLSAMEWFGSRHPDWASVSFVDTQVGRILAALDELGLRDDTIIVFWGDHGYHLGEKGKWSKHHSLWETGTRVPFMFSAPGVSTSGTVSPRVVESLSLYPTLVELCGIPPADGQQGVSIVPLLRNPNPPSDRPALTVSLMQGVLGRSVRTERWRYADWDAGKAGAMLLDMQNDPEEQTNLINDPKHARVVARMKKLLEELPPVAAIR